MLFMIITYYNMVYGYGVVFVLALLCLLIKGGLKKVIESINFLTRIRFFIPKIAFLISYVMFFVFFILKKCESVN
jgi:hypothetical protein